MYLYITHVIHPLAVPAIFPTQKEGVRQLGPNLKDRSMLGIVWVATWARSKFGLSGSASKPTLHLTKGDAHHTTRVCAEGRCLDDLSALKILVGAGVVDVRAGRLGRAPGHMLVRVCAAVHAAPGYQGTSLMKTCPPSQGPPYGPSHRPTVGS